MFERFETTARDAITISADEAGRRGDRRVGTDHLLLGVLHDPDIASVVGIDVEGARARLRALDRQSLAAVGVEVGDLAPLTPRPSRRTQFGSGARAVLPRALRLASTEKARRITTRHLLLALLEREQPDPVAVLLAELEVDRSEPRSRLITT